MKHYNFYLLSLVVFLMLSFSCSAKGGKSTSKKQGEDTIPNTSTPSEDKSYLKKRPEEFKEFFLLSSEPAFTDKVATKQDVKEGKAVFNLNSNGDTSHHFLKIRIPFFAFINKKGEKKPTMVVVMQADSLKGDTILGYRASS